MARTKLRDNRLYLGKDKASVIRQQKLLHSLGYGLGIDGVRGQITQSAWDAYKKGMSSSAWNRFIKKRFNKKDAKANQRGNAGAAPAPVTGADLLDSVAPAYAEPAAGTGTTLPQFPTLAQLGINPSLLGGKGTNGFDAIKYAQSLVNAEYGPQIAQETRSRDAAIQEQGAAQQSIGDWYKQVMGEAGAMAGKNTAALDQVMSQYNAGVKGAAEALGGGPAAADAAAWGAIGGSQLGNMGQIQTSYLTQLPPAYALQGADSMRKQLASDRQRIDAMNARISDLTGARGESYTKAIFEGLDKAQRDRIAEVNMQAQMAMLPAEYAEKMQGMSLRAQDNARANSAAARDAAGAQIGYDLDRLRLAAGIAELNQTDEAEDPVPAFGKLDPGKLQGLRSELLSTVVSKSNPSALAVNPMRVYNAWGNALRGLSGGEWNPASNPQIRSWRDNLLRSFLPGWNSSHPNKKYGFRNGKLVYLGKK
jgi:hypothetical protein